MNKLNPQKLDSSFWFTVLGIMGFLISAYFTWDDLQYDRDTQKALQTPVYLLWTFFNQGILAASGYCVFGYFGWKRYISAGVWMIALTLSLQATMAQRATRYQERLNSEISNDTEYSDMRKERARLIAKIDQFELDIAEYTKQKLITLGVRPTEMKKKKAEAKLEALNKRLQNYSHGSDSTAAAPYMFWAKFFSDDNASEKEISELANRFKFWRDTMLAILLDVGGSVMWGLSARQRVVIRRREDEIDTESIDMGENVVRPRFSSYNASGQNDGMTIERIEPSASASQLSEPRIPTLPDDTSLDEMPRNRNGKISGFSKSTLLEHIKNMFHEDGTGPKDGHLRGQKRTAELYNAVHDVGGMAHTWLKDRGLINVKGRYSYPEMSQPDMLKKVSETYSY